MSAARAGGGAPAGAVGTEGMRGAGSTEAGGTRGADRTDGAFAILFVCHGNICRSVSAQCIFQNLAEQAGLAAEFRVDSAATSREELGSPIYPPMRRELERRGVPVGNHRARQLTRADYDAFDLVVGMDAENMRNMRRLLGGDPAGKLHLLMEYAGDPGAEVDDPWYTRDFAGCAAQLERGCRGLLASLRAQEREQARPPAGSSRNGNAEAAPRTHAGGGE